ncbi:PREDICTED: latexin [Thamnophis sirtalis]|uniref:Latexin n=1 Tax=Thamnophis sirtalis TaxID=35019 RepID=A0A6I9XPM4_9SAUR|nr:PREDICTED: latexin [Thamnophis sirtalis]
MWTLGGPGAPVRLLQLLLLPASLVPADPERPPRAATNSAQQLVEQLPVGGQMEISASHYAASRAAGVVFHYLTYQRGSPHRLFEMGRVKQASLENIPGSGHKYRLKFEVKESIENGTYQDCTAEILYHLGDTPVAPEIHYTMERAFKTHSTEADNLFYSRIQHLTEPLETRNIPDNVGNMPEEMKPIFNLAKVASGYIVWQNSTENTLYNMIQIKNVKQVKRNDDYLEFSYEVLFHDIVSQETIPWHMQVLWHPQHGVKVTQNSRQSK